MKTHLTLISNSFLPLVLGLTTAESLSIADTSTGSGPILNLGYGSFQGVQDGNIEKFLGVPFAAPPVGNLRFAPPEPPIPFTGIHSATEYGAKCPQQGLNSTITQLLGVDSSQLTTNNTSEDCLFVNVIKPALSKKGHKIPVVFWIYGGGFEAGDTSFDTGDTFVNRSIALDEPVIYVSANYRLNAFGFLGGKEAKAAGAGNVGLKDQIFALKWVQQNIAAFGGDPKKVTLWGQSAGSISASLQLFVNDGDSQGLFRAALMQSGSPKPLQPITSQQPTYDQLVNDSGCAGANDTFICLRDAPYETLTAAVNKTPSFFSYESVALQYIPSVDGELIKRNPVTSIRKGLYAKIPIMSGDMDDEGTQFSLVNLNITTDAEFREYVSTVFFPGISSDDLDTLARAYPEDITKGSPFDTGTNNSLTPQYKRLAAFQGDYLLQSPRRTFLKAASKTQPVYGYINKRNKRSFPFGSFHSFDLPEFYGSGDVDFISTDALINFINTLDPNTPKHKNSLLSSIHWPQYGSSFNPPLLTFLDPSPSVNITTDTFRAEAMSVMENLLAKLYPL